MMIQCSLGTLLVASATALAGCQASDAGNEQRDACATGCGCEVYCQGAAAKAGSMNWNGPAPRTLPCDELCAQPEASGFEACCDVRPGQSSWLKCEQFSVCTEARDRENFCPWEWVLTEASLDASDDTIRLRSAYWIDSFTSGCASDRVMAVEHEFSVDTSALEIAPSRVEDRTVEEHEAAKWEALGRAGIEVPGLGTFDVDASLWPYLHRNGSPVRVSLQHVSGMYYAWNLILPTCQ